MKHINRLTYCTVNYTDTDSHYLFKEISHSVSVEQLELKRLHSSLVGILLAQVAPAYSTLIDWNDCNKNAFNDFYLVEGGPERF